MEKYVEKNALFSETRNAHDLLGLRVLTSSGDVLGRVKQVQLHKTTFAFEGVFVKRSMFRGDCYMCKSYIDRITHDAILLSIEPALLYVGHTVISSDGKVFGKVKEVHRVHQTNQIASLLVKHGFFRKVTIPFSQVKKFSDAIILKKTYAEACKRGS